MGNTQPHNKTGRKVVEQKLENARKTGVLSLREHKLENCPSLVFGYVRHCVFFPPSFLHSADSNPPYGKQNFSCFSFCSPLYLYLNLYLNLFSKNIQAHDARFVQEQATETRPESFQPQSSKIAQRRPQQDHIREHGRPLFPAETKNPFGQPQPSGRHHRSSFHHTTTNSKTGVSFQCPADNAPQRPQDDFALRQRTAGDSKEHPRGDESPQDAGKTRSLFEQPHNPARDDRIPAKTRRTEPRRQFPCKPPRIHWKPTSAQGPLAPKEQDCPARSAAPARETLDEHSPNRSQPPRKSHDDDPA